MAVGEERIGAELLGDDPLLRTESPDAQLTGELLRPIFAGSRRFTLLIVVAGLGTLVLLAGMIYTVITGIGVWGNNIPVAWAFGITNFVFWIGIGHAGTFISAILLLFKQRWRTSINRIAEAMTLFAVLNAGLFPLLHLGRPWFFYWLVPYPATMNVWPQFRSALTWDIAAVSTYLTISFLFWYIGLVPDLAAVRDHAPGRLRKRIYGFFALGWRGSARHWRHYRVAYGLLAGLATPLVISVHSVVSLDFATAKVPGWHSTIFPPYFVAGAIFSGFAMVLTLMLPARHYLRLENVITTRHLDNMAKLMLVTGGIVAYAYMIEIFSAYYSGNLYERYEHLVHRPFGRAAWLFWVLIACNVGVPQLFWFRRVRRSPLALFITSIFINIGMWVERFVIVATSLERDFLPSSWSSYTPTLVDGAIFFGTIFLFVFLFLLFLRFVPFIPVSEVKEMRFEMNRGGHR
jgi:molybdopterin-containing oxidoreductase family membrane subunit